MFDFIFASLEDEEEGLTVNQLSGRSKRSYVGERCTRVTDYPPCGFMFADGTVWALDRTQLHTLDGEPVAIGVLPAMPKYAPKKEGARRVRCVETGTIYESLGSAAKAVRRRASSIRNAIVMAMPCAGFTWEWGEDE